MKNRILFLLKRKEDYCGIVDSHVGLSTGLYNSASFVNKMLNDSGIESHLEVVTDNNDIDREVTKYKPTHVIIEALWVVPEKFDVLTKLHPEVKWIVRLHSELPFLANEGIAMGWLADYTKNPNVYIGVNAPRMLKEIEYYIPAIHGKEKKERIIYLPNYYPTDFKKVKDKSTSEYINIGCFGAIRPLKNHMVQAIAAIKFADSIGKKLRFHINYDRVEMKGEPILHNLMSMFDKFADRGHQLVNHPWTPRAEFLKVCADMDIGMQVSFSETFNIVGADLLSQGVPVLLSEEIPWASSLFTADPASSEDIFNCLRNVYRFRAINVKRNQYKLKDYVNSTRMIWIRRFG